MVMINKEAFYDSIRKHLFGGKLTSSQVQGMESILNEWERKDLCDKRRLAYMLATAYHETARTMQPIEEYGKGKGRVYGKPDSVTGKIYYGRGFVQLTWKGNYQTMGKLLGIDLVNHPDWALKPDIAVAIMFEGMLTGNSYRGDFTGKSLEDYFNEKKNDPVNARRIINGTDKAELIASYHIKFLNALT
jgi:putative chitinase